MVNLAEVCTVSSVVKTAKSMHEAASQIGDLAVVVSHDTHG